MKILAVDDDDIILELVQETMDAVGYGDVTLAGSGSEAIRLISESPVPFDCFLLDIQMPEMDGIELCRIIRGLPDYNISPIIMITAMSDKKHIDEAFSAGAIDYVAKPFDVLELGARVRLAEILYKETRSAAGSACDGWTLSEQTGQAKKRNFEDPVEIEGIVGVINYVALKNYVRHLTRAGFFQTSAFAIKIPQIEMIFAGTTDVDFRYILTEIAEVISARLNGAHSFLSYSGRGVFLCICQRGSGIYSNKLEPDLRSAISNINIACENGESLDLELFLSELKSPTAFSTVGKSSILDSAILSAENNHSEATSNDPASQWSDNCNKPPDWPRHELAVGIISR